MDQQSQYDGRAYLQNYLDNPGFEQAMEGHVIIVGASPSASSFTDTNDGYDAEPTGWWNGAPASVRTGLAAGKTFAVAEYTAGGGYTCSGGCPIGLVAGDIIGVTMTNTSIGFISAATIPGNWYPRDANSTISTAQKYAGASSLAINVSDGATHEVTFDGDTAAGTVGVCTNNTATLCTTNASCTGGGTCKLAPYYPWHPITGPFQISFYALASGTSSGSPSVQVTLTRFSSSWGSVTQTFPLTNDGNWHQYTYSFTGSDQPTDTGTWEFAITGSSSAAESGATIYVDNVFLGPTTGAAGGFRTDTLNTLKAINPGVLRYMTLPTLTQTDANFEASDYTKGPSADGGTYYAWTYSVKDMYAVAGSIGAVPYVNIPDVFSDTDLTSFAGNLCSAFSTYGFSRAYIEQSNEDWASGSHTAGGSESTQFGNMAARNFGIVSAYMLANCTSSAANTYFIAGGQEVNSGVTNKVTALLTSQNANYGSAVTAYIPSEPEQETGQTMAQYAALGFSNSVSQFTSGTSGYSDAIPNSVSNLCGSAKPCDQFLAIYEEGNSNQCGTATPVEAYEMSAGWMAAGFNGQNWILALQAGIPVQNVFNFAQLEFPTPGSACTSGHGTTSALWGVVHDLNSSFGPTFPHLRPIGQAMELADSVIGGDYYAIDTASLSGVYGAAFENNGNWSALLSNASANSVKFIIDFPSFGTVPATGRTILYTSSMGDNNEDSNSVTIGELPGGVTSSGQAVTVTLPAFSLVALGS